MRLIIYIKFKNIIKPARSSTMDCIVLPSKPKQTKFLIAPHLANQRPRRAMH